ncbi:MAG: DUF92 domain-containing protein [Gemmatimonadota bacterium]|nr:DUF92 domain-containing protein [Gemmatimonadota bacterium]
MPAWSTPHGPALPLALLVALAIALPAWRTGNLSTSGAVAATLVGATALVAGWPWGTFLILWFAITTLASRCGRRAKQARTMGVVDKGAQRDAMQVLANGGVYGVGAAVALLSDDPTLPAAWWASAALAAAGADTLATEIGTWIGGTPRSVRTWQPVPAGRSGAVSVAGTAAMVGGALLFAALAVAVGLVPAPQAWIVAVAAVTGALVDTVVGAFVQQLRWCPRCAAVTEQRTHACGTDTVAHTGWHWLTNDQVNLVCTLAAALTAVLLGSLGAPAAALPS